MENDLIHSTHGAYIGRATALYLVSEYVSRVRPATTFLRTTIFSE